ncbi:MAG TPA: hypothetical protein DEB39_15665 [Planctomycetaceae bacterium]|nr:hypothetical protein [Planctomycetaceae bacterium]
MLSCRRSRPIALAVLLGLAVSVGTFGMPLSAFAQTVPRWKLFLDALGQDGYYDTALDYLNWMDTVPFCPPELKTQMDYQIAMVHLDAMESGRLFLKQTDHLKCCRESLAKFLGEHPDSEYVFETNTTLGNLLLQEGRSAILRSTLETTPVGDRPRLVEEARSKFQEALKYFETADKLAVEAARKVMAAGGTPDTQPVPFGRVIAGKIFVNLVGLEIAKTYPKDGDDFKKRIDAVAVAFEKLGSKYSEYAAGFEAKLYAAKAYRDLGDTRKTREILAELNVLSGEEYMRILTGSLLLTLEINLAEKNYQDSITRVAAWADNVPLVYRNSAEGQTIYLEGAKTLIAYAESIQGTDKPGADRAIRTAGGYLRAIRLSNTDTSREAQKLLVKVGAVQPAKSGEIATYADANERSDEDFRNLVVAVNAYRDAGDNAARLEAQKRLLEIGARCELSIQRTISMRETDTPIQEINRLRAQLANVYNIVGKRLEAAILANFIARRYSSEPDADKMASMAVKLFRTVFIEEKNARKANPNADPTGYADELERLADFIMQRWRDKEVADEVMLIRMMTAIESGRFDEVREMIAAAPAGKPYRTEAELRLGLALWSACVAAQKQSEEARPSKKKLREMLDDSKKELETGMKRKLEQIADGAAVDWVAVHSAITLAQIALNDDDSAGAVAWLNREKAGPMTLIRNPPSGISLADDLRINDNTKLSVYMMQLRAEVGAEQLDKAETTMNELEELIKAEHGDNDQKLTAVYVSLGRQLEERLKELNESGDTSQRDKLTKGFELFLKRIRERKEGNTFQSLYWVADTYYRLGNGLTPEGGKGPEEAMRYFKEAAATYVTILRKIEAEPEWAPPKAENTIKVRMAESLRQYGDPKAFKLGMQYLSALLEETENRIDIQLEAARMYQAWGASDPAMYLKAIGGGDPDGDRSKRHIWGWNGIIKRTSNNIDRFRDEYYGAYHGKFRSCIGYAAAEKGTENAKKLLDGSLRDITRLVQNRPDVGGEEWLPKIDRAYRDIQKALGQTKPTALTELIY